MKPKRRIYDYINVNDAKLLALFDSGARNSYITRDAARNINIKPNTISHPFSIRLGSETHILKQDVNLDGTIQNLPVRIHPYIVTRLGVSEKSTPIDILFGIEDMETWFVELDIKRKKIDMTHYKSDFIEY